VADEERESITLYDPGGFGHKGEKPGTLRVDFFASWTEEFLAGTEFTVGDVFDFTDMEFEVEAVEPPGYGLPRVRLRMLGTVEDERWKRWEAARAEKAAEAEREPEKEPEKPRKPRPGKLKGPRYKRERRGEEGAG
jgi:hypothetical protein